MRVRTFYRAVIWLPLAVPALLVGARRIGVPLDVVPIKFFAQVLLGSLLYAGPLYAILAVCVTVWIWKRDEPEIEHLMLRAPLIMGIAFWPFALTMGIAAKGPPSQFLAFAIFGSVMSVFVGYGYVAAVLVLRRSLGDRLLSN